MNRGLYYHQFLRSWNQGIAVSRSLFRRQSGGPLAGGYPRRRPPALWHLRQLSVPRFIDTPQHGKMGTAAADGKAEVIPIGRVGTAKDIARTVAFLAADEAAYIVGIHLVANGGLTQI